MKGHTRDALLWLAGLGGAVVLFQAALALLQALLAPVSPVLLGMLLVLLAAGIVALAAVRSRLRDDRTLAFTEHRP